jgi:nucleoside-triphosphatase
VGRAVLLTGRPGVGKTTLIKDVVAELPGRCGGFYTEEVRAEGRRIGFQIVCLDGGRAWLAREGTPGLPRVGRYGVYVANVEGVCVPAIQRAAEEADVVVVDEIGKMELLCSSFLPAILAALASTKPLLGTVTLYPHTQADKLKAHESVTLVEVTLQNRERLLQEVLRTLAS